MPMITTVTLVYEGPSACIECQRQNIQICAHIGFTAEAWTELLGGTVMVPGLDNSYTHTLRDAVVSADRKTITLTVDTDRPSQLDLARNLSVISTTPKAWVRAVDADTGVALCEGAFDAFLQQGQQVWVGGAPYVVSTVDQPGRHADHGTVPHGDRDWQVAELRSTTQTQPVTGES
jgi:hypothetical protein